jgi:hypothetical protein
VTAPAGEPGRPVDTAEFPYEVYPRWVFVLFLFGPLILAAYTTTGVGWVVTAIGGIAGLFAGEIIARDTLIRFTTGPGRPRRRRA